MYEYVSACIYIYGCDCVHSWSASLAVTSKRQQLHLSAPRAGWTGSKVDTIIMDVGCVVSVDVCLKHKDSHPLCGARFVAIEVASKHKYTRVPSSVRCEDTSKKRQMRETVVLLQRGAGGDERGDNCIVTLRDVEWEVHHGVGGIATDNETQSSELITSHFCP